MRMRPLGKTGLQVSELGFGSLFASSLGPGSEQSRAAVHEAVSRGINYFDTAPAYANSEELLGAILKDIKAPLIVSTKLGGRPQPFDPRNTVQLKQSVEQSLRLLHRDVIDVLFIHEPDRPLQYPWWTDPEAVAGPVLEVLDDLKRRGLIRFTGVGGTTVAEMAHLVRSGRFDVVLTAFNYSALFREAEQEVIPAARERGMGIVLGSVLRRALGRRYDQAIGNRPMGSAARQEQFEFYRFLDEPGCRSWSCVFSRRRTECEHGADRSEDGRAGGAVGGGGGKGPAPRRRAGEARWHRRDGAVPPVRGADDPAAGHAALLSRARHGQHRRGGSRRQAVRTPHDSGGPASSRGRASRR